MKSIWAKVTKAGDNTKNWFVQQINYKGKVSNVLPVFPYGFFAHAKTEKSLGLIFCVGGKTENKAGILFDPINRPELLEGEIAIYQPETNTIIKFLQDQSITVTTDLTIDVSATAVNITGKATVTGDVTTGAFGTNGKGAQSSASLGAAATDLGSVIALSNAIRTALINNGIGS